VENYWMALLRDVHFSDYTSDPTAAAAAADLAKLSDFPGRKTAPTLFRGTLPGDLAGPYLSQFMLHSVPFGAQTIKQTMKTLLPGHDYMTDYPAWLAVQRGAAQPADQFDTVERYIRNGRDLSQWVHVDALYQAYFNACLILLGARAPVDKNNPYVPQRTKNQDAFATFGGPHILSLVTEVATRALKAVWFQKWFVHRRLRPEAFAGRVHNHLTGKASYPLHQDVLHSGAAAAVKAKYGGYLLPMAFPEGSPLHPSYGSGHATVAGACVTILKAWFDETATLQSLGLQPVVASSDGLSLVPYAGADAGMLTVGGELNKIASNIGIGRNIAGVHWNSDYTASVALGEEVAISVLRDQKGTYNERFEGFSLTRFNGQTIII
jgi:membrane-associated phospholipid phosphatase